MGEWATRSSALSSCATSSSSFLSLEGPVGRRPGRADAACARSSTRWASRSPGCAPRPTTRLRAHRHSTSRLEHFNEDSQAATGRLDEVARRVQAVERALEPVGPGGHRGARSPAPARRAQGPGRPGRAEDRRRWSSSARPWTAPRPRSPSSPGSTASSTPGSAGRRSRSAASARSRPRSPRCRRCRPRSRPAPRSCRRWRQQTEEAQQAARQALNDLREQMRKSSESFELENRGLHAVSERVGRPPERGEGVRGALRGARCRQPGRRGGHRPRCGALGEQSGELSGELGRLAEEEQRIGVAAAETSRGSTPSAGEVTARMRRIEELRPAIEEAVQGSRHRSRAPAR